MLYELYVLRSPFAGPGMNYYMLGHKLLAIEFAKANHLHVVHSSGFSCQLIPWGLAAIRSRINRAEYPPLPAEAQRVAKLCSEILQVEQDVMASKGVEAHQRNHTIFCLFVYVCHISFDHV